MLQNFQFLQLSHIQLFSNILVYSLCLLKLYSCLEVHSKLPLALLFSFLCLCVILASGNGQTRSSKKGLVIPYWPRHFCHDFDHCTTVGYGIWYYNYNSVLLKLYKLLCSQVITKLSSSSSSKNIQVFVFNYQLSSQ